jgi:hypothetical protein
MAQLRLIEALYGSQVIAPKNWSARPPKRQPVGAGRRSPGAFGAIRAVRQDIKTKLASLSYFPYKDY